MAELKTQRNDGSVIDFINSIDDENKRQDSMELIEIFEKTTGEKAMMRGSSIVGFGSYSYKSEKSKQQGDRMLTAFSPRKAQISIYIMPGFEKYGDLLGKLGKHKVSKGSCLYIKKLSDVDIEVLKELIKTGYDDMKKTHCN